MEITRNGSRASARVPGEWFTGTVRMDPLFQTNGIRGVTAGSATFEPGARTNWHTHPKGQTLLIISGLGWIQRDGGPIEQVGPGDVVWFEAGERHWHGASSTVAMTRIAIQESVDGRVVDWLEPVSDCDYGTGPG